MKTWLSIALLAVVMTLTGCLFETYHETAYYDLRQVAAVDSEVPPVAVMEFENWSGTGRRMRVRVGRYRIVDDEYSRWAQPPNTMLSRFLSNCFPSASGNDAPLYRVSGRLTAFEVELDNRIFVMRGQYSIQASADQPGLVRDFAVSQPFSEKSPEGFAAAASRCAAELAKKINGDLADLVKANVALPR